MCVLCVGEKLPEPAVVSQVYPGVLMRKCGLRFQPRMTGWPVTTDTDRRTRIIKLLQTVLIAFLLVYGSLKWLEIFLWMLKKIVVYPKMEILSHCLKQKAVIIYIQLYRGG